MKSKTKINFILFRALKTIRSEKIENEKQLALKDRQLISLQELCRRLQKKDSTIVISAEQKDEITENNNNSVVDSNKDCNIDSNITIPEIDISKQQE